VTDPDDRRAMLKDGWKDVGKIFTLAFVLDLVYQVVALRGVSRRSGCRRDDPGFVPYLALRSAVTKLARRK
jgi:hypothetical protein